MRHSKIKRLAAAKGYDMRGASRIGLRAFREDYFWDLYRHEGKPMFEGAEVGSIVCVETISFPVIGEVVSYDESRIVLKNGVRVLWDGRHGPYASEGKPPASAEIEKTFPLLRISTDAVIAWGEYPGGKIPTAQ